MNRHLSSFQRSPVSPVARKASSGSDLGLRRSVAGDGAAYLPPSPVDTSFYPDSPVEALRVERVFLYVVLLKRGLIA